MARQGIYFGLAEADYHADPALGSTDIKKLAVSPVDFWFGSIHNPTRLDKEDTAAQIIGTATHKLVLEGRAAFDAAYAPAMHNGATKEGKAESAEIAAAGKIRLKQEDWQRILLADGAVKANKHLVNAFTGGLSEVSVFWTSPRGIEKKARFDHLKIRANSDLKTIAPKSDSDDFVTACRKAMANYHYGVQAGHYNEGRTYLQAFLNEGLVFGDHDQALLRKIAEQPVWSSVFTFLKKTGAPLTYACSIGHNNPLLELVRGSIMKAEDNYLAFVKEFGFDTPWLTQDPVEELQIDDMPGWWRSL